MQRNVGNELELGATVLPFDTIGAPSAIERSTSNSLNAGEKVQRIIKLSTVTYDTDIAKCIPGKLDFVY